MVNHRKSLRSLRGRKRLQFGHAALVGVSVGIVAVLFQICLGVAFEYAHLLLRWSEKHTFGIVVFPCFCALCAWLAVTITKKHCPEASGSGIPQVKGVLIHLGSIRWLRVLWVKFIGGLLVIGTGFTLGREGPTVHLGAAIGLGLTKLLHLPSKLRLHYVACGAGAGLAAAFNAPLAGFVFVLEELRKEFSALTYGTALVATVLADVVTRIVIGAQPSLYIPMENEAELLSLKILPAAIVIGICAGVMGGTYSMLLVKTVRYTQKNPNLWFVRNRALIVGFAVGLIGVLLPISLGPGGLIIKEFFQSGESVQQTLVVVFALLLLKIVLNIACYAISAPGGIFTPMLAQGALMGLCLALLLQTFLPTIPFQAWAVLAMAAYFTGVVQAPLTGVILTFEMTGGYNLLFPLMVACMLSYFVAQMVGGRPVYEALLRATLSTDKAKLELFNEPELLDLVVEPQSFMAGKRLMDLNLPAAALVLTITRAGEPLVPCGGTCLIAGDQLTIAISNSSPEIPQQLLDMAQG